MGARGGVVLRRAMTTPEIPEMLRPSISHMAPDMSPPTVMNASTPKGHQGKQARELVHLSSHRTNPQYSSAVCTKLHILLCFCSYPDLPEFYEYWLLVYLFWYLFFSFLVLLVLSRFFRFFLESIPFVSYPWSAGRVMLLNTCWGVSLAFLLTYVCAL